MSTISAGFAIVRDQPAAHHRIEQLERRISKARMGVALALDWNELLRRSRAISAQLNLEVESVRQIAAADAIREGLYQANDGFGLRALRLATAGPMTGWLHHESTRSAAQSLSRRFAADQRRGIPGLADLERRLEQARAAIGSHTCANAAGDERPRA